MADAPRSRTAYRKKCVHISPEPGLGYDINWEYINGHLA
jgi:hypothetical protein